VVWLSAVTATKENYESSFEKGWQFYLTHMQRASDLDVKKGESVVVH